MSQPHAAGAPGAPLGKNTEAPPGPADERRVPGPWRLDGTGFVIVSWLPATERDRLVPPGFDGIACRGPLSITLLVNYETSDIGPYRELLYIPGRYDVAGRTAYSIARIWVSTRASVVNGRANWGIPKELAEFTVTKTGARRERWEVGDDGGAIADLELERGRIPIPVHGGIVPAPLRTLVQRLDGQTFTFAPTAKGFTRSARLLRADTLAPARFPDLGRGRSVATHASFDMQFPVAEIGVT